MPSFEDFARCIGSEQDRGPSTPCGSYLAFAASSRATQKKNSPAGKLRTPTPTTALTMLNISLLMVAVPPPSPPRTPTTKTSTSFVGVDDDDDVDVRGGSFTFMLTVGDVTTPSRRGLNASDDEDMDAPRRRASAMFGAVA